MCVTFKDSRIIPTAALTKDIVKLKTPHFPEAVAQRNRALLACHIAGTTAKLHMSRTMLSGFIGRTVSITMLI